MLHPVLDESLQKQYLHVGEIKDFQTGDYVNKKMARRMDDVIKYTIVAGKKVFTCQACMNSN